MRSISFALTIDQVRAGTKDVTRRLGWRDMKPGTQLRAVNKVMGFRKGEKPIIYGVIEVVSVRREPLSAITADDVAREGFPGLSPEWFVVMFQTAMRTRDDIDVTRIEFKRVGHWPAEQEPSASQNTDPVSVLRVHGSGGRLDPTHRVDAGI